MTELAAGSSRTTAWRLFAAGVLLMSGGFVVAFRIGTQSPRDAADWSGESFFAPICRSQFRHWDSRRAELCEQECASDVRGRIFASALLDPGSALFVDARDGLAKETAVKSATTAALKALEAGAPHFGLSFMMAILGCGVAGVMLHSLLARLHDPDVPGSRDLVLAGASIAAILVAAYELERLVTQTAPERPRVGWNALCVRPGAFVATQLGRVGAILATAVPLGLLATLTTRVRAPRVRPEDEDGRCGVGWYIDVLEIGTAWCVFGASTQILAMMRHPARSGPDRDWMYFLFPTAVLVVTGGLVTSAIARAHDIRRDYQCQVAGLRSRAGVYPRRPAPPILGDPTSSFLGDAWYHLPAVITAALGAAGGLGALLSLLPAAGTNAAEAPTLPSCLLWYLA